MLLVYALNQCMILGYGSVDNRSVNTPANFRVHEPGLPRRRLKLKYSVTFRPLNGYKLSPALGTETVISSPPINQLVHSFPRSLLVLLLLAPKGDS
jgi:hypothetical protein